MQALIRKLLRRKPAPPPTPPTPRPVVYSPLIHWYEQALKKGKIE